MFKLYHYTAPSRQSTPPTSYHLGLGDKYNLSSFNPSPNIIFKTSYNTTTTILANKVELNKNAKINSNVTIR